jgi:hypothetical protein
LKSACFFTSPRFSHSSITFFVLVGPCQSKAKEPVKNRM